MTTPHESYQYYAMTLDPVHVGTGGSRLGRVDNAIVREPGTNLPKIPGTSISGVCRANSAMAIQSADSGTASKKYRRDDGKSCVGKGSSDGDGHCGDPSCEICVTFGFSRKSGSSFQGLAQFFDARILFFPVYSMKGPVWVTCVSALTDFGVPVDDITSDKFKALGAQTPEARLNFGWLYLERDGDTGANITSPIPSIDAINDRIYIVSDKLFSRIVNDNLEVRTSVAIDPQTGAAEDGALYTYEAIPRATVLWFDVVYNRPEYFKIRVDKKDVPVAEGKSGEDGIAWIKKPVTNGLNLFKDLGIGGMNTRGMGRLKILNPEGAKR